MDLVRVGRPVASPRFSRPGLIGRALPAASTTALRGPSAGPPFRDDLRVPLAPYGRARLVVAGGRMSSGFLVRRLAAPFETALQSRRPPQSRRHRAPAAGPPPLRLHDPVRTRLLAGGERRQISTKREQCQGLFFFRMTPRPRRGRKRACAVRAQPLTPALARLALGKAQDVLRHLVDAPPQFGVLGQIVARRPAARRRELLAQARELALGRVAPRRAGLQALPCGAQLGLDPGQRPLLQRDAALLLRDQALREVGQALAFGRELLAALMREALELVGAGGRVESRVSRSERIVMRRASRSPLVVARRRSISA